MCKMTLPTISFKTFLTLDVRKTCSWNIEEIVAWSTYDWSWELFGFFVVKSSNIWHTVVRDGSVTNEVFFLEGMGEIFCSLLQSWPNRCAFGDWAELRPFQLVEKMVVLIEKFLFFLDVARDCQLDFTHQTSSNLSIYQDIPCSHAEPVLDTNDIEGIFRIIAFLVESLHKIQNLALLGHTFAPE